ncbi:MAG: exodeoxyribonuclease VII small subunit [Chloroflexi bacterium RBG_13_56_8]|nr:MAG: exodeoxyribonuclease VII small subunit [Chloroflexi bacterium RBG_13_56_8]
METKEIESLSFEDSYAKLEEIIQRLEGGELSLDDSMSLYEEGMRLAQQCGRQLDDAELKVYELLSAAANELEALDVEE